MPTWVPKYNTLFVEPLAKNLLTYMKTHSADAIAWAYLAATGLSPLPAAYVPFPAEGVYNSTIALGQKTFPDLFIWKITSPTLDEAGDESDVKELHNIVFCFELVGEDVTELTERQWRYMNACDSMCRAIPNSALYAGMTGTRHGAIEVVNHDYGMPRKFEKELWLRAGMLTVAIAMQETRNNAFVS